MMENTNVWPWCRVRNKNNLPNKIKVHHVKRHKDKNSRTAELSLSARLNIAADKLISENSKAPLMINTKNTPIEVYIYDKYIPNNYVSSIRNYCRVKEARKFMTTKYDWSSKVISNIEWKLLNIFIKNKSYSTKKLFKSSSIIR